jgi:predicted lipid-binding transport protein (Tim44 family)
MARLLVALVCVSACGGVKRAPVSKPAEAASPSKGPAEATRSAPSRSVLAEAKRLEKEGRSVEAAALLESAVSPATSAKARLAAQLHALELRLSATGPARDLRKAQALLEAIHATSASTEVSLSAADLLRLLEDLADQRAHLRGLRSDVKTLEAAVAKKDEALRRMTSAVVSNKTP